MNIQELIDKIKNSADEYPDNLFSSPGRIHTCVNPYAYHILKKNNSLYEKMDGIFVDGITMCWLIRLLWGKKIPRLSFDMAGMAADLFTRLDGKPESDESIFLIGAKKDEIEGSIKQIRNSFPNIKIAGFRDGYFPSADARQRAVTEIVNLNPSFTIVGMGAPLQEQFIVDLKQSGYKGIAFTCGGFLHQSKNRMKYYPEWVNKYNLRALYRLFHEKGMLRRLWNVMVTFPISFTVDTLKHKSGFSR